MNPISFDFLNIRNNCILIVGVSGCIGSNLAVLLKNLGAKVYGFDITSPPEEIFNCLDFFQVGDVANEGDIKKFFENVPDQVNIDNLVYCTGSVEEVVDAEYIDINAFKKCLDTSLVGAALLVKHMTPNFKKRKNGHFIFLSSSDGGLKGNSLLSAYTASKHGINGLMKSYARELGPWGIRVNSVLPGTLDSPMSESIQMALKKRQRDGLTSNNSNPLGGIPLGRLAKPSDISNAIAFLISEKSSYVHGCQLVIDGGQSVK
jgi:NAD(P)-dependent dehydrogenase (short-subunit alcohol dehydrogenase family)